MSRPLLSIVIPVYNSEQSIHELFHLIDRVMTAENISYEIIAVDDGSKDKSWKELKNQTFLLKNINAYSLQKNYGQQAATLCGILHSSGEYIVTIDDDLEYAPEDIKTLLFAIEKTNLKIIYGYAEKKGRSVLVNGIAKLAKKVVYGLCGLSSQLSSFRIFPSHITTNLSDLNSNHFLVDALLKKEIGQHHSYVKVKQHKRRYGKSNYRFGQLVVTWVQFLFASSRFGAFFALTLLSVNIAVLLNGNLWLALVLCTLAVISTYLTSRIKWVERTSFVVKEEVSSKKN